jgi:hypothetical protein
MSSAITLTSLAMNQLPKVKILPAATVAGTENNSGTNIGGFQRRCLWGKQQFLTSTSKALNRFE